jgi:hypothetical protein
MPYALSFRKQVPIADREQYINECCVGSRVRLAVDVFTDDPQDGRFQLHLTSRRPRMLLGSKVEDTPQLERLRQLVVRELEAWPVTDLQIEQVDENYMPFPDDPENPRHTR